MLLAPGWRADRARPQLDASHRLETWWGGAGPDLTVLAGGRVVQDPRTSATGPPMQLQSSHSVETSHDRSAGNIK